MKNILITLLCLFSINANAQDPCEGIDFLTISYNAFTDTSIIVHLTNTGPESFSYPGFILINNAGDTFAMESVNFFGIGQESIHSLEIRPGVMNPADIFDGTLELHTGFYDSLWCSWPIYQSFCPSENCTNMTIGMQNWGGALVTGDFEYFLNDSEGNTIETGTYTMVDTIQYWEDTLCIPFGEYTYAVNALGIPSGGGPVITVSQFSGYGSPTLHEYFDWYNGTSMNVPFHTQCEPEEPNSIQTPGIKEDFTIVYNRDEVRINCDSQIIGVEVHDIKGQLIKHIPITDSTTDISSGLSLGVYVALARFASGKTSMKKFLAR